MSKAGKYLKVWSATTPDMVILPYGAGVILLCLAIVNFEKIRFFHSKINKETEYEKNYYFNSPHCLYSLMCE